VPPIFSPFTHLVFKNLSRLASPFAALLIFAVPTLFSATVELHLKNGDRLSGELVGRQDGYIIFRSSILGDLKVRETDAVVVATPQTPVESLAGIPPAPSTLPRQGAKDTIPASPTPAGPPKTPPWRGKVEFGFLQQTGRKDNVQISFRGDAERIVGTNTFKLEARALYGEQYEETTSDRYDGQFRWRHELSPRTFSQLQTSYTRDKVKLIYYNVEENFGVGYKFVQKPRHTVNAGVGVTAQYRDAAGVEAGTTYLGEIFEDYTYKLTGRLTILQDASVAYSPDERNRYAVSGQTAVATDDTASNYRLRFNTALQGKVTDRVSLNVRFEYEFDNAILDPKAKVDQRITTSIGYGF
jgi:putative salt-induced outer membrane protein YdiY